MRDRFQPSSSAKRAMTVVSHLLAAGLLLELPNPVWADDDLPPEEMPTEVPTAQPTAPPRPPATTSAAQGRRFSTPHPRAVPQMRRTRYSRYRTSWYIGFGLGIGSGWYSEEGWTTDGDAGGIVLFRAGVVVQPWLLLGADISFWVSPDYSETGTTLMYNHYDAVATLFPLFDQGLYVKGGIGIGSQVIDTDEAFFESQAGFDLKLGAGWEFQVGDTLTVGADLTYVLTATADYQTHDLGLAGTLNWY